MAWCENPECRKDGLRKADVEFDETIRKVLCHGCMTLMHPGWAPPEEYVDLTGGIPTVVKTAPTPKFGMAIQLNPKTGLDALFSYGQITLSVHLPTEEVERFFG